MGDVTQRNVKIAQYSRVPQNLSRTPSGVLLETVSASLELNPKVFDTLQNVITYTELDTQQKVYDWFNYFGTIEAGIQYAYDLDIQVGALISTGNKNITFTTVGNVGSYNGTTYSIKATTIAGQKISTGGVITLGTVTPIYPIQFSSISGTSNWLKIDLTSGQVALLDGVAFINADYS